MAFSVVIPYAPESAAAASAFARALDGAADQVLLAGKGRVDVGGLASVEVLLAGSKGAALRAAVPRVRNEIAILQDPDPAYRVDAYQRLVSPLAGGSADAVFGSRFGGGARLAMLPDLAMGQLARLVTDAALADPLTGQKAFRTEALRSVRLSGEGAEVDAELVVKLAAQLFRLAEVPLSLERPPSASLRDRLRQARTLVRYATTRNDADNAHQGYNTLVRMDAAPNYNAWIGRRLREHLGARVLEIGAGIGTVTREIEAGRELLIALEVDGFYVDRLKNLFRGKPHVRPYLSDVALADWESLRRERLDTIVLSNVLEHIEDDGAAVRRFRQVLGEGGRLLVLVPALPRLYGGIDEAVGHFRRYTRAGLRSLLQRNGFEVESLEWMNALGIPGWFVNSRLLGRRAVPPLQLRLYDRVAPLLAEAESRVRLPIGMSLFAVARAAPESP